MHLDKFFCWFASVPPLNNWNHIRENAETLLMSRDWIGVFTFDKLGIATPLSWLAMVNKGTVIIFSAFPESN